MPISTRKWNSFFAMAVFSGFCRLGLHRKVLEEGQKSAILDVCRFCLDETFDFFQVIEDLMGLLHVILIASLENTAFTLLIVEKAQFNLYIHWILKLFDSLLHGSKVAREVVFRLLLHKGENYCQLIEKVIDSVQNGMQRQIGIG